MVALVRGGSQFCGGTLVASKYVISAAHCMSNSAGGVHTDADFQVKRNDLWEKKVKLFLMFRSE